MKAEFKNGNLIVTIPHNDLKSLPASKSGKSVLVATTGGNKVTGLQVDGKNVTVGLTAYIPK